MPSRVLRGRHTAPSIARLPRMPHVRTVDAHQLNALHTRFQALPITRGGGGNGEDTIAAKLLLRAIPELAMSPVSRRVVWIAKNRADSYEAACRQWHATRTAMSRSSSSSAPGALLSKDTPPSQYAPYPLPPVDFATSGTGATSSGTADGGSRHTRAGAGVSTGRHVRSRGGRSSRSSRKSRSGSGSDSHGSGRRSGHIGFRGLVAVISMLSSGAPWAAKLQRECAQCRRCHCRALVSAVPKHTCVGGRVIDTQRSHVPCHSLRALSLCRARLCTRAPAVFMDVMDVDHDGRVSIDDMEAFIGHLVGDFVPDVHVRGLAQRTLRSIAKARIARRSSDTTAARASSRGRGATSQLSRDSVEPWSELETSLEYLSMDDIDGALVASMGSRRAATNMLTLWQL